MKPIIKKTTMNKTELRYADRLEMLKVSFQIIDYKFEPLKLILVHNLPNLRKETSYTPDFLVVKEDCFEFHEVKGRWREDARLKIKHAAELFPWFRFLAVQFTHGEWVFENFN